MSLRLRVPDGAGVCNRDEVRRSLILLADHEQGAQLHCAPSFRFQTFVGTNVDAMLEWVELNQDATGIFYTLNSVRPDLDRTACVGDILRRRWLLVDIDRHKAIAEDDPATEQEHESARLLAQRVHDHLDEAGWPPPVLIDSGNGFHLLYRVDVPVILDSKGHDTTRSLFSNVLKKLASRFDGWDGTIGVECCDARRLARLPGTWSRRGKSSEERPYRITRLLSVPAFIHDDILSTELMTSYAGSTESNGQAAPKAHGNLTLPVGTASRSYARAALEREVAHVVLAPVGKRNNILNTAAFNLGQLVGSELLTEEEVAEALFRAACACGLDQDTGGERGIFNTIQSGLQAGKAKPRTPPDRKQQAAKEQSRSKPPRPAIYSLPALMGMNIPPPRWAVPGLMSEGLTILAGRPKQGKSWMALNLGITIAAGGMALGSMRVVPGNVLYLSLEDRLRRVQDRAGKIITGMGCGVSDRMQIAVEWPPQSDGGMDYLEDWCGSVSRPTLIVIDVWAKFRDSFRSQGSQYEHDYKTASAVKSLGDRFNCSILILHHVKKAPSTDMIDDISGTLGLAGAADGSMVLVRSRGENEAVVKVTGRDVEEQELAVKFDKDSCCWHLLGKAAEITESKQKAALLNVFKANPGSPFGVAELMNNIGATEGQKAYIRNLLYRMAQDGLIDRVGMGRYRYPVQEDEGQSW